MAGSDARKTTLLVLVRSVVALSTGLGLQGLQGHLRSLVSSRALRQTGPCAEDLTVHYGSGSVTW